MKRVAKRIVRPVNREYVLSGRMVHSPKCGMVVRNSREVDAYDANGHDASCSFRGHVHSDGTPICGCPKRWPVVDLDTAIASKKQPCSRCLDERSFRLFLNALTKRVAQRRAAYDAAKVPNATVTMLDTGTVYKARVTKTGYVRMFDFDGSEGAEPINPIGGSK